jgi:uncharacterized protein YhaN
MGKSDQYWKEVLKKIAISIGPDAIELIKSKLKDRRTLRSRVDQLEKQVKTLIENQRLHNEAIAESKGLSIEEGESDGSNIV